LVLLIGGELAFLDELRGGFCVSKINSNCSSSSMFGFSKWGSWEIGWQGILGGLIIAGNCIIVGNEIHDIYKT
jgi:hypothetical protein